MMALSTSQLSPLILRNRSVPRHAQHYVPRLDDINRHVNNYIKSIENHVLELSLPQQIHYWSSKISEHVHICIDILLPEFNNFSNVIMVRWLTIGYSLYQLTQIWKTNKENISSHTRLDEWLPFIVKQKLPPNLIPRGQYSQLRKYVRIWENRDIVTALPKLRGEHTHRLEVMNTWIREFEQKVRIMAVQRDIAVPDTIDEQIKLYRVYLENHSVPEQSDDEDDECKILDAVIHDDIIKNEDDDGDILDDDKKEEDEGESDDESVIPKQLSKKDAKIAKYQESIKKLKSELSEIRRKLKFTQSQHCHAARERHVYRELHKQHKDDMDQLHDIINRKNQQLINLNEANISLKHALIETKRFLRMFKTQFIESRKLYGKLIGNKGNDKVRDDEENGSSIDSVLYYKSMNDATSSISFPTGPQQQLLYNPSHSSCCSSITPRSSQSTQSSVSSFASQRNFGSVPFPGTLSGNNLNLDYNVNDEESSSPINYEDDTNSVDSVDSVESINSNISNPLSCPSSLSFVSDDNISNDNISTNDNHKTFNRSYNEIKDGVKVRLKRRKKKLKVRNMGTKICKNRDIVRISATSALCSSSTNGSDNTNTSNTANRKHQKRRVCDLRRYMERLKRENNDLKHQNRDTLSRLKHFQTALSGTLRNKRVRSKWKSSKNN